MKRISALLFLSIIMPISAQETKPEFAIEMRSLPADFQEEIVKYLIGNTLNDAVNGIKKLYVLFPGLKKDVDANKMIIAYVVQKFSIDTGKKLQDIVKNLNAFTVFKEPRMQQWIAQETQRLNDEEELRIAAHNLRAARVEELIKKGTNVNAKNKLGQTALHKVLNLGFLLEEEAIIVSKIVLALLNAGASVNEPGIMGETVLQSAISRGLSAATIKEILKKGANPNARDSMGHVPLHLIAGQLHLGVQVPRNQEIMELLLTAGADASIKSPYARLTLEQYIIDSSHLSNEKKEELINLIRQAKPRK